MIPVDINEVMDAVDDVITSGTGYPNDTRDEHRLVAVDGHLVAAVKEDEKSPQQTQKTPFSSAHPRKMDRNAGRGGSPRRSPSNPRKKLKKHRK